MIFKSNPGVARRGRSSTRLMSPLKRIVQGNTRCYSSGQGIAKIQKERKDQDRIYAFKDKNVSGTKGESDLVNVTGFYSLSAAQQASTLDSIKTSYGWYIILDKKDGEKCLASSGGILQNSLLHQLFPRHEGGDPCFIGEGTASLYAVNYGTGEAVFNFDLTNDVGGTV